MTLVCCAVLTACGGDSPGAGGRLGTQSGDVAEFHAPQSLAPPIAGCNETPSDCGGDPTGTWHMSEMCGARSDCPGGSRHDTHTGSMTFASDGTLESAPGVTTETSSTPLGCGELRASDCTLLDECTVENDACQCEFISEREAALGQWASQGNQLRILASANTPAPEQYTFCVQGDRMQMWAAFGVVTLIYSFERE